MSNPLPKSHANVRTDRSAARAPRRDKSLCNRVFLIVVIAALITGFITL